jgi:hypothetical protein
MASKAFVYPVSIKSASVAVFAVLRLPFDTGGPQALSRDRAGADGAFRGIVIGRGGK